MSTVSPKDPVVEHEVKDPASHEPDPDPFPNDFEKVKDRLVASWLAQCEYRRVNKLSNAV